MFGFVSLVLSGRDFVQLTLYVLNCCVSHGTSPLELVSGLLGSVICTLATAARQQQCCIYDQMFRARLHVPQACWVHLQLAYLKPCA